MSFKWISWAWDQKPYQPASKLVLLVLADNCGMAGDGDLDSCGYVKLERVQELTGLTAERVKVAKYDLIGHNLIKTLGEENGIWSFQLLENA